MIAIWTPFIWLLYFKRNTFVRETYENEIAVFEDSILFQVFPEENTQWCVTDILGGERSDSPNPNS